MEEKILKAMYPGVLNIGNSELLAYVLEDGTRVLSANSFFKAFGRTSKGRGKKVLIGSTGIPDFMPMNLLKPYENGKKLGGNLDFESILASTGMIEFYDGGTRKTGYKSELLVTLCELYDEANRAGLLTDQYQIASAECARILLNAFARVGLDGLIDEATGYKHDPKYLGLRILLDQYIAEGLQKWTKTFPDKFFEGLDGLYGNDKTSSRNRPSYYGKFINKYIYDPLEDGLVKKELNNLNIREDGRRRARFHQWLTENGKNELRLWLGQVMGLINTSPNIRHFKERYERLDAPSLFTDEQWATIKAEIEK